MLSDNFEVQRLLFGLFHILRGFQERMACWYTGFKEESLKSMFFLYYFEL